jgi:hypothetical protein
MENKNIHTLDQNSFNSLKEIIFSSDKVAVEMGMVILKNLDLNDEDTIKYVVELANSNVMDLKDMDADVLKDLLQVFITLRERGLEFETKGVVIEKTNDSEVVKELSLVNSSIIEEEFIKRKHLAEEWLNDSTTEEQKFEIEKQIHVINKKVADLLGIEYSDQE